MRVDKKQIEERAKTLEERYDFDPNNGWGQVLGEAATPCKGQMPRTVAYGYYAALRAILEGEFS